MVENKERDITALELYDIMKDFSSNINDSSFGAFIMALLLKEFFPLLHNNMPYNEDDLRVMASTMSTTITTDRLAEFAYNISKIIGLDNACKIAALVDTLVFDEDIISHINNKEVN